jgi:outer membrane biosynthesis protein TonB
MKTIFLIVVLLSLSASALTLIAQTPSSQQVIQTVADEDMKVGHFEDMTRYPPFARAAHRQGIVVIRATLDGEGSVVDAAAVSGSQLLIPDSLTNAKKWRFQPNAYKAAVIVYNFRITGLCYTLADVSAFSPPNLLTVTTCEQPVQP